MIESKVIVGEGLSVMHTRTQIRYLVIDTCKMKIADSGWVIGVVYKRLDAGLTSATFVRDEAMFRNNFTLAE